MIEPTTFAARNGQDARFFGLGATILVLDGSLPDGEVIDGGRSLTILEAERDVAYRLGEAKYDNQVMIVMNVGQGACTLKGGLAYGSALKVDARGAALLVAIGKLWMPMSLLNAAVVTEKTVK